MCLGQGLAIVPICEIASMKGGSNTNQGAQGPPSAPDLIFLMLFTLRREEGCSLFAPTGRQCLVCTSVHRQAGRGVCDVQIGWCSQHSLDFKRLYFRKRRHQIIWGKGRFFQSCTTAGSCAGDQGTDKLISGDEARPSREKLCTLHACTPPKPSRQGQKHFNFCYIKIYVLVIVQGTLLN